MGILELKQKRKELETHISRLIGEFEKSTSLVVEEVTTFHTYIIPYGSEMQRTFSHVKIKTVLE